ncbi:MAG: hypothetical protein AB7R89_21685 [Dehalococcoidia bacterium]
MSQTTCPTCGMQQSEWLGTDRQGFVLEGQRHCCEGCARGAGCTCRVANPGIERQNPDGDAATRLMTPRDRNGRPLSQSEVQTLESRGAPVQLEGTGSRQPTRSTE